MGRQTDLLRKRLGKTEKQIAVTLKQKEGDSAVLAIDEVQGLLADRRTARDGWQVS